MRVARVFIVVSLCGSAAAIVPVGAHHSVLGFDGTRGVALAGTVREVVWANPHTVIILERAGGDGEGGERWAIESEGAGVLARLGWSRDAIAVGDYIRTTGAPARSGAHRLRCDFVRVPSGSRLPCYPARSL